MKAGAATARARIRPSDQVNHVAEDLTGWTAADAEGRELAEVFAIFRQGTRERAESPMERVLGIGRIVGLANLRVLVSRGGGPRAMEDSAALIQVEERRLRGIIRVFRDTTEKRRGELAAKEARNKATPCSRRSRNTSPRSTRPDGRLGFADKVLLELWSRPAEDAIAKTMGSARLPGGDTHPSDGQPQTAPLETGRPVSDEIPYRSPIGAVGLYE